MRHHLLWAVVLAGLVVLSVSAPASAATTDGAPKDIPDPDYARDEVLVTLRQGILEREARDSKALGWGLEELSFEPVLGLVTYRITDGSDVDSKLKYLAIQPDVARVNKN